MGNRTEEEVGGEEKYTDLDNPNKPKLKMRMMGRREVGKEKGK